MTLEEAYEIFFGESQESITPKFLVDKYTEEIINRRYRTLAKQYHPDLHPDNADKNNEIMASINNAREILIKGLEFKEDKVIFNEVVNEETELAKIIPSYLKLIDYAVRLRKYQIKNNLYKNTVYYYNEIKYNNTISERFELYNEYVDIYKKANSELAEVDRKTSILRQKISAQKVTFEYLYNSLKAISGDCYQHLDDPFYKHELACWERDEQEKAAKDCYNMASDIMNFRNILLKVICNSDKIRQISAQEAMAELGKTLLKFFETEESNRKKAEYYLKYLEYEKESNIKSKKWSEMVQQIRPIIERADISELDADKIAELEKIIFKYIPDKYSNILLDNIRISMMSENIQKGKKARQGIRSQMNIKGKQLISWLIEENKKAKRTIEDVDKLFSINRIAPSKIPDNDINNTYDSKFERSYTTYKNRQKHSETRKKEAIDLYYYIFICYYITVKGEGLPQHIDEEYKKIESGDNRVNLDKSYEFLTNCYKKMMSEYKKETERDFVLNEDLIIETNQRLYNELDSDIATAEKSGIVMSSEIIYSIEKLKKLKLTIDKLMGMIKQIPERGYTIDNLKRLPFKDLYQLSYEISNITYKQYNFKGNKKK